MGVQQDIETLAQSLRKNGLAASDTDAVKMAERMLGVSKTPEQKAEEARENELFSSEVKTEPKPEVFEEKEKPVIAEKEVELSEKEIPAVEEPVIEENQEEPIIKIEDIEPIQEKTEEELESGFKEIPIEKKQKPTLTKEEKKQTDLSKLFYYGDK